MVRCSVLGCKSDSERKIPDLSVHSVATKLQRGPVLKLIFSLAYVDNDDDESKSEIFNIINLAEVRFQFTCKKNSSMITFSLSYKKHDSAADCTVKINITCKELQYSKQYVCPENFTGWVEMGDIKRQSSMYNVARNNNIHDRHFMHWGLNVFEVTLNVYKMEMITFPKLYEDDEYCDFHLMTVDGIASVPVHRACLVVHSDMFRRMLNGEWKETINGCIKIQGVTLQTLQHLKEYFYLGTLPEDYAQLQLLLLLGKCYMVDNLRTECVMKLAGTVEPGDLLSLQDFAVANQIPELLRAIMQVTPDETVHSAHLILMENEKDAGPSEAKKIRNDENVV